MAPRVSAAGGDREPGCGGEDGLGGHCLPSWPGCQAQRLRSGSSRAPELPVGDSWGQAPVQHGDQPRTPNAPLCSILLAGARNGSEGHGEPEEPKPKPSSSGASRKRSNCQAREPEGSARQRLRLAQRRRLWHAPPWEPEHRRSAGAALGPGVPVRSGLRWCPVSPLAAPTAGLQLHLPCPAHPHGKRLLSPSLLPTPFSSAVLSQQ